MIQSIEVKGLNGRFKYKLPVNQESFNHDLNIFTGPNGTGKTTLLKLIWFLTSGNLERIIPDIPFQYVKIQTNKFWLSLEKVGSEEMIKFDWEFDDTMIEIIEESAKTGSITASLKQSTELEFVEEVNKLNQNIASTMKSSFFFSTFRRLEGGFTTGHRNIRLINRSDKVGSIFRERTTDILQSALSDFSSSLSFDDHNFVTSISTRDIVELLTTEDANLSAKINTLQSKTLDEITQEIKAYSNEEGEANTGELVDATSVLNDIENKIKSTSGQLVKLRTRFNVLNEIVDDLFEQYGGIQITENLILGTHTGKEAISSDKLSSGEKQFLGLLCHNAFIDNTTIYIDEPELSLHTDIQRILLPVLLEQGTDNQFFIASHSPFIYARFPDKEIRLGII